MDQVTVRQVPACPRPACEAGAGDPRCYTATGFPRPMHSVRIQLMQTIAAVDDRAPATEPRPAGRLAGRTPSPKQGRILAAAIKNGGVYEVSEYRFAGDAQRRAAVLAMVGESRGWMRKVDETAHASLYEITTEGRNAEARYRAWMNGDQ